MTATIFALASAPGKAGVAVWRLSGPESGRVVMHLTGGPLPPPRLARRVRLVHDGETLDDGLVLWFPAPNSFTGEDVAEFHLHGGRAVSRAVSVALTALGLRPAEPGEFSRRAFHAGKMDLTRAEAIADLVDAETAAQRRQALRQLEGGLEDTASRWRSVLVRALALLEAEIDFADEDLPEDLTAQAATEISVLISEMEAALAESERSERLRDGLHVAILGAPNAGKSSLLNRLAGREAAIVSGIAGTTRDVIEVHLDLNGWPVILADTAGLRDAVCEVEAEGVRRALARAESADVRLAVFEAGAELDAATLAVIDDATLVVVNKHDVAPVPASLVGREVLALSALTGQGIDGLVMALSTLAEERLGGIGNVAVLSRARHRAGVKDCLDALSGLELSAGLELAAEDLRRAAQAIGRLSGRVETEEILDHVFREFCIGK